MNSFVLESLNDEICDARGIYIYDLDYRHMLPKMPIFCSFTHFRSNMTFDFHKKYCMAFSRAKCQI